MIKKLPVFITNCSGDGDELLFNEHATVFLSTFRSINFEWENKLVLCSMDATFMGIVPGTLERWTHDLLSHAIPSIVVQDQNGKLLIRMHVFNQCMFHWTDTSHIYCYKSWQSCWVGYPCLPCRFISFFEGCLNTPGKNIKHYRCDNYGLCRQASDIVIHTNDTHSWILVQLEKHRL